MSELLESPVMVTGGSGYIASHLVRLLLKQGATVHATVRDPEDKEKVGHLHRIASAQPGTLRLFKSDLLELGSFEEPMQGCALVYHTASPFQVRVKEPQQELMAPAVMGTRNVMRSVSEVDSVRRVVMTSSTAAIFGDAADTQLHGRPLNEQDWNITSSLQHNPYSFSKSRSEQEAWGAAEAQDRWELLVMNPGFVLGPSLSTRRDSFSVQFLLNLISGRYASGMPQLYYPWADVRDVAQAHLAAGSGVGELRGRCILVSEIASVMEIVSELQKEPRYALQLPSRTLPRFLMTLLWRQSGFSKRWVKQNVGIPVSLDVSKAREQLGWRPRPALQSFKDHIDQLLDYGFYTPPSA